MKSKNLFYFLTLSMFLCSCVFPRSNELMDPEQEIKDDPIDKTITIPTETVAAVTQISSEPEKCQESFQKREMREPYQRYDDQPRYVLSDEELQEYLDLMRIEEICFPNQIGSPFINVDWGEQDMPATGRMVSIGFEELYEGGGWSSGYILYATYDFSVGAMHDIFATPEDYDQVQNGAIPNPITVDGVNGFVRFHSSFPMGMQMIMKTYVFPFEKDYFAVVINIGAYDPNEIEEILTAMEAGNHPDLINENITLMDSLVATIRFQK